MSKGFISPSLMCLDLMNAERDVCAIEAAGVDYFHLDVMDNHFVPNITLSPDFIRALKKITKVPLDVHLMIDNPESMIPQFDFLDGNDVISFHYEACVHQQRALAMIRAMGVKAGIAISPATPLCVLEDILPDLDWVVLMTVNPGFAGQKLIPATLPKITRLRGMLDAAGRSDVLIEVDGNVSFVNAEKMHAAGADVYVAGTSSVFSKDGSLVENMKKMREIIS